MSAPDPIFVRTRHSYDSYSDFWRLVELSGFRTCFVDQMDLQAEELYITTPVNGELRAPLTQPRTLGPQKARIIWWNLERPDSPSGTLEPQHTAFTAALDEIHGYVDAVWVSDRHYATFDSRLKFVPLGSHPGLSINERSESRWDVAMMGVMIPRREGLKFLLERAGYKVAPNGWGAERDHILRHTTIMLNVHQHDNPLPIGEPLRIALAAAYRMILVSEHLVDPSPLGVVDYCDAWFDAIVAAVRNSEPHKFYAENLHQKLCHEYTFRRCVEEALSDQG
jgi:hypothetical protein